MEGDGSVQGGSKLELVKKGIFLAGGVVVGDPTVEADFADGRFWIVEVFGEFVAPVFANLIHIPGMQAVGRYDPRVLCGELGDCGPVFGTSAVDDDFADGNGGECFYYIRQVRGKTFVVEMIVRVVNRQAGIHACSAAKVRIL